MVKFNHMSLPVANFARSRDWYVGNFGFEIEFDQPQNRMAAIRDHADFTIFLQEPQGALAGEKCSLSLQVDDVERKYRDLTERGVVFEKAPGRHFWGYGTELRDPDGYLVTVWDEKSMREQGNG